MIRLVMAGAVADEDVEVVVELQDEADELAAAREQLTVARHRPRHLLSRLQRNRQTG